MQLPRSSADRLFQGFVSLFMSLVMAMVVLAIFQGWKTSDWTGFLIKAAVEEIFLLFFTSFALLFIWCLFTPAWVERLMVRRSRTVAIVSSIAVLSLLAVLLWSTWRESFSR